MTMPDADMALYAAHDHRHRAAVCPCGAVYTCRQVAGGWLTTAPTFEHCQQITRADPFPGGCFCDDAAAIDAAFDA